MKELTQKIAFMKIDQYDDAAGQKRPVLEASDYAVILVGDDHVYPKFPIDTRSHVKESADALEKVKDKLPDEIVKVAQFYINQRMFYHTEKLAFDIETVMPTDGNVIVLNSIDQDEYMDKLSSGVSINEKYALELDNGQKYIPINDETEIKEACEFIKNASGAVSWEIPGEYRIKIARALLKESPLYFIKVPKSVRRYATPTTTVDDLKRAAKARIKIASAYLDKILKKSDVDYLQKIADGGESNLVKVCDFFNRIDEKTGYADLKRRTNQGDAYDELFVIKNARLKKAESNQFLTVTEQKHFGEN